MSHTQCSNQTLNSDKRTDFGIKITHRPVTPAISIIHSEIWTLHHFLVVHFNQSQSQFVFQISINEISST